MLDPFFLTFKAMAEVDGDEVVTIGEGMHAKLLRVTEDSLNRVAFRFQGG